MIKTLRKRHRQVWIAWAVLIPAGILFAWLVIPNQPPVKLLQASIKEPLPVVIKTSDSENYTVNIRTNQANSEWQVEWCNKTVLTVPSAVIYRTASNDLKNFKPENAYLIGRIEATGKYIFPINADSTGITHVHLVLYDFIHDSIIDTINFLISSPAGRGKEGAL
jgi:hypothetical protein